MVPRSLSTYGHDVSDLHLTGDRLGAFCRSANLVRPMKRNRRFASVAAAGITFQAGSAAVDSATIMSALVFQLTGSSVLVGAVTAILRFGWLFPQPIVGFFAQRSGRSMKFYVVGAFGPATCMALLALVLILGAKWPAWYLSIVVMSLWTAYSFVSGIVAVPYTDIPQVEGHLLYASTNLGHDQAFRFRCAVDLASWRGFCPQRLV